jgi:hypothetical protein
MSSLERALLNLEHEIAVLAALVHRKHNPWPALAREIAVTAMVMEAQRDPRAFATRLNGLARQYMLDPNYRRKIDGGA